ncbi:MAG: TolC family protein [bacterium]
MSTDPRRVTGDHAPAHRGRARLVAALLAVAIASLVGGASAHADTASLALAAASDTPASASPALDLEQAFDRALATDQSIRSAVEAVAKADLLPWSGLTRLAPRITAQGRYDKPEHDITSNLGPTRVETRSASITLEQPLLDLTAIPAYRQGTLAADAARLRQRFAARNLLFAVAEAYFEVLKQARISAVTTQTLELAEAQLRLAQRRFQVGEVTRTDELRARVVVEREHQRQIEAENALRLARHTLASILNLPSGDELRLVEPPPLDAALPALDEAESRATAHREDLAASRLEIEQQQERRLETLAQYAPRIAGTWTDQWLDPETFSTRNDFWEATVGIEIPLFEGGQRELDVANVRHDITTTRLAHESLAKSIDLDVRDAWLSVRTLTETLDALRAQVAAAEENYRDLESQYRAGEATSLDLQSALTDLGTSRTDLAARTFDLEIALRNLERAEGSFQDARVAGWGQPR